LYYQSIIKVFN